jgi:hypothetical protein
MLGFVFLVMLFRAWRAIPPRIITQRRPENEGLHPKQILDYIHAKDGNGKVVYGIEAFVWIREACGYKFRPIFAQIARAFCRLFARYRYKLSGDKLVCGPECDHPMT